MGCGMSTEEKEGKARNEEIENQLKKDRLMQRNEIKMLLLGTSPRPHQTMSGLRPSATAMAQQLRESPRFLHALALHTHFYLECELREVNVSDRLSVRCG